MENTQASQAHLNSQKPILLIGAGDFAAIVRDLAEVCGREVAGYVVNRQYRSEPTHEGLPLLELECLGEAWDPEEVELVLAFSARGMADFKAEAYRELKAQGFHFANLIHPSSAFASSPEVLASMGEGNIAFPQVSFGSKGRIGTGNTFWTGAILSHHNILGDFNTLGPGATLAGYVQLGSHCFLGAQSVLKNGIVLEDYSFVGAAAYVTRDVRSREVIVPPRSYPLEDKEGHDFL